MSVGFGGGGGEGSGGLIASNLVEQYAAQGLLEFG